MNISVVIPVYNAEKFIARALDSCLNIPEIKEIIVVDDGYKDNSRSIADSYAQQYTWIKVFQHPDHENKGASASRNLGIKHASHEFISFLDADDFYLPNRFIRDKEIFKRYPDADGCYNALGVHYYSKKAEVQYKEHFKNKEITTVAEETNPTPRNLLEGLLGGIKGYGHFSLDCLTVKREALCKHKLNFNSNLLLHQDSEFIIRLAHYCIIYPSEIKTPTAKRGVHEENRITANFGDTRQKKYGTKFLQFESLYKWAKKEQLHPEALKLIKEKYDFYKLAKISNPTFKILGKEIIKNPKILKNDKFSNILEIYTKNKVISRTVFYQLPRYIYKIFI